MTIGRREFLAGAGALALQLPSRQALGLGSGQAVSARSALGAAAQSTRPGAIFPASVRTDFPSVALETYLNSASMHPLGTFAARGIEQAVAYRLRGAGPGRVDFGADQQQELKKRYGQLIGASANEIAYTANTSDGENIVVMGMDLPRRGGNIVIDELHFTTSLYMYKEIEKKGVELRIVKHRNWAIDVNDMDRAIDKNTRLVSLALVSNVNGFMHDAAAVSALAHARGAYLFADIIQAVGAVPIDMRALGIDFASAGTYKWLMGERGIGFLYVREDLQGTVLPTTRYGHRQVANFNRAELTWEPLPGAAKYETGGIGVLLAACVSEGIAYVQQLGLDKIRAHARQLTDRLQTELPPLGYKPLTPRGTETPILAFELKDAAATAKALHAGKVAGTVIANENRLRLSVSVFNTHDDIDRVVEVLGGRRPSSAGV
jgi:selenocysteine lyase/cysteine desulfurase